MNEVMPKPDMRGVRVNQDTTPWTYSRRVGDLCERCGDLGICKSSSQYGSAKFDIEIVVSECEVFRPIILFVKPEGIDGEFNTMRLGKAWSKRLKPDSIVSLWDKKRRIGNATVVSIHAGDKFEMIKDHGNKNHMIIDKKLSSEEAFEPMIKIVRSAYGNLIWKHNQDAAVIYLSRK
jgi:hypothetical protein